MIDIFNRAKSAFTASNSKYGLSWLHFRPIGLADQIFIKVKSIVMAENGEKTIDSIVDNLYSIINYCIMLIMKEEYEDIDEKNVLQLYDEVVSMCIKIHEEKNRSYGEAWKDMHPYSLTDMINVKIHRIINAIVNNKEHNIVEEAIDIANYAIFRVRTL